MQIRRRRLLASEMDSIGDPELTGERLESRPLRSTTDEHEVKCGDASLQFVHRTQQRGVILFRREPRQDANDESALRHSELIESPTALRGRQLDVGAVVQEVRKRDAA